jgi:hypothetical protein
MRRVIAGLALLAAARVALAQSPEDLNADRETTAQLDRILSSAREKRLPIDPIIAKARQGVLLRTPPARIVAAAEAVSRRLEDARDALAPSPTANDIAAGQDALAIPGVTKDMLHAIRAQRPNRPVAVAIGVMAQLAASGVEPGRAAGVVADLVRRQATDGQLASFGNEVNRDVSEGIAAVASLNVRLKGLTPLLPHLGAAPPQQGLITTAPAGGPKKPRP